jgi:hypothetical protein
VGILYAIAFSYNNAQMRYIADHTDIQDSLLQEILNYAKVISTGAFGGRLTKSAYNIVLSLSKYYKPYIEDVYRQMGDDPATAEQRYQRQFVQQNPWGDATAHLTGDPLQITQRELLDRLNAQYPGGAASSSSGAAPASVPEDEAINFIVIISPYIERIQVASNNILHSLLRPKKGQYTNIFNFDRYENLNISATACDYLHKNSNTFIGILYAALFRNQMEIIDYTYKKHRLNYPVIEQATRAYFNFLKSTIPKTLKIEIMNFCLQYSIKYEHIFFEILQLLNFDNPELKYHQQIDDAERFIERDINEFSNVQPQSVFNVSGLNSAPSGPAPSQSAAASSGTRSRGRPKAATQPTPEGDPRISRAKESAPMPGGQAKAATRPRQPSSSSSGPTGASLKPLVRETKDKLPLPYYDTENDPYIFNHGKINNI